MNFEYSPEQNERFAAFADFCEKTIRPRARDMDGAGSDEAAKLLRENTAALADFGYLGLGYPEK